MNNVLKLVEGTRVCNICKEPKALTEFHVDRSGTHGRKSKCKICCNKIGREKDYPKHKRSGLKNRPDRLKKFYGVTYEEVENVLASQHGLCANRACGREISLEIKGTMKTRAVIDHCHNTGKFRALLCNDCNLTLGKIEADKNKLLGLLEYLDKHTK